MQKVENWNNCNESREFKTNLKFDFNLKVRVGCDNNTDAKPKMVPNDQQKKIEKNQDKCQTISNLDINRVKKQCANMKIEDGEKVSNRFSNWNLFKKTHKMKSNSESET